MIVCSTYGKCRTFPRFSIFKSRSLKQSQPYSGFMRAAEKSTRMCSCVRVMPNLLASTGPSTVALAWRRIRRNTFKPSTLQLYLD